VPSAGKKSRWEVVSQRPLTRSSQTWGVTHRSGVNRRHSYSNGRHAAALAERATLVWIDDYEPGLILYKTLFEQLGFRVLTAANGRLGLDLLESHHVDAVITDYEMPGMDGEAVATSVKNRRPELPVLMFSGSSLIPESARNIVDEVCDKAGSREALLAAINRVLEEACSRPVTVAVEAQEAPQLAGVA
jgi:DNA-binding NtrC family response regulator